jgi:4'-phosphopantetheinyl transferase
LKAKIQWKRAIPSLRLGASEVHVWRIHLANRKIASYKETLSSRERRRAATFRFEADRRNYIAAHAGLREILAGYLKRSPAEIEYEFGEFGKPRVVGAEIEFNLSHSGQFAICVVTAEASVGVDIELIDLEFDVASVYRVHFTSDEAAWLDTLDDFRKVQNFYALWVQKEAYLKARGLGIGAGFIETPLDPLFVGQSQLCVKNHVTDWAVQVKLLSFQYAFAVAVSCLDPKLQYFQLVGNNLSKASRNTVR